jgi:predicted glutamine amidotransferase
MCRWIAYRGKARFLEDLILKPTNSLIQQSLRCREGAARTNGDGFGIGWYANREEPGVYREVLPAWNDLNLRALAHQIRSPLFFAHVRVSTGTETSRLNCHPFSHGRWLFMHNGQIGGYECCRRRLEALLSDELYASRQGTTDSELFFLLMVQNGLDDDPQGALRTTIGQVTEMARACGATEPFKLTVCLANGDELYACRHASFGTPPSLYWQRDDERVLVASEPYDDDTHAWNAVDADSILSVGAGIRVDPLFPEMEGDTRVDTAHAHDASAA